MRHELCEQHGEYESKYGKGCPICLAEAQRKKLQERLIEDAEKEAEAIFVEPRKWYISYSWSRVSGTGICKVVNAGYGSLTQRHGDGSPIKESDLDSIRNFAASKHHDEYGNQAKVVILNIIEISPE